MGIRNPDFLLKYDGVLTLCVKHCSINNAVVDMMLMM